MKRKERLENKRRRAQDRREVRMQRTPREQLSLLNRRPGKSKKERKRLETMIALGYGDTKGHRQYSARPNEEKETPKKDKKRKAKK